jgi:hypothetical protein
VTHPDLEATALVCVEQSSAYCDLYSRLLNPKPPRPSEYWKEDNLTYLVFDLVADRPGDLTPLALFVVDCDQKQVLLARLITLGEDLRTVYIEDLYQSSEGANDGHQR